MPLSDNEMFLQEMVDVTPVKDEQPSQTEQAWLNPLSVTDAQVAKRAVKQHELLQLLSDVWSSHPIQPQKKATESSLYLWR
jgi:hypothetical protein